METSGGRVNRSTTERLKNLIDAELARRKLTDEQAARDAKLPSKAFRALRNGHRPSVDRADELCRALGVTMVLGQDAQSTDDEA